MFDFAFAALVLLLAAPLFALVALAIKLDSPGPVLFRQKRYGYRGRIFFALKFRTMKLGAEEEVRGLKQKTAAEKVYFKLPDDPRITRVGKFLRRFSLDEFPQFWNVLKGEMSVVGPRPLSVATGEKENLETRYGAAARKVFNVLPGITGLWQVSGRSELSDDQRFALDLFYVERWSPALDAQIILRTPAAMLRSRQAH